MLATDETGRTITVAELLSSFPLYLLMQIMLEISRAYGLNVWYDSTGKIKERPGWVRIRRSQDWVILPDLED